MNIPSETLALIVALMQRPEYVTVTTFLTRIGSTHISVYVTLLDSASEGDRFDENVHITKKDRDGTLVEADAMLRRAIDWQPTEGKISK